MKKIKKRLREAWDVYRPLCSYDVVFLYPPSIKINNSVPETQRDEETSPKFDLDPRSARNYRPLLLESELGFLQDALKDLPACPDTLKPVSETLTKQVEELCEHWDNVKRNQWVRDFDREEARLPHAPDTVVTGKLPSYCNS